MMRLELDQIHYCVTNNNTTEIIALFEDKDKAVEYSDFLNDKYEVDFYATFETDRNDWTSATVNWDAGYPVK